jgi:hypothetical protein
MHCSSLRNSQGFSVLSRRPDRLLNRLSEEKNWSSSCNNHCSITELVSERGYLFWNSLLSTLIFIMVSLVMSYSRSKRYTWIRTLLLLPYPGECNRLLVIPFRVIWRSWLRHYPICRKFAASVPDVTRFCNWPHLSSSDVDLEVDSVNISLGVKSSR